MAECGFFGVNRVADFAVAEVDAVHDFVDVVGGDHDDAV